MKIVLLIVILIALSIYLVRRRPVWLQQISLDCKTIFVCSNCQYIWRPTMSETEPPEECPRCTRKMRLKR